MVLSSDQERAILKAAHWSDEDIADLDPEQRAYEVEQAISQGVGLTKEQEVEILRRAGWPAEDLADLDAETRRFEVEQAISQGVAASQQEVAPRQSIEPQDSQRPAITDKAITAAWTVAGLLLFGFAVKTGASMPSYAVVFLNDATQTYVPLPCLEAWQASGQADIVGRALARDAYRLKYKADPVCEGIDWKWVDGRSLSGLLLQAIGVLSPLKQWWDKPYRTEDGVIVNPKDFAEERLR